MNQTAALEPQTMFGGPAGQHRPPFQTRSGPTSAGSSLADAFGRYDRKPCVYVRTFNNVGMALISRSEAASILGQLRGHDDPLLVLHGGIRLGAGREGESGFSWIETGSLPARRHVVRPLRVTGVSLPDPISLAIELTGACGSRRRTSGLFPNVETAQLAASCLWSSLVGRGASRADLVCPDGRRMPVTQVTQACGLLDRALIEVLTGAMTDSEDPTMHGT